MFGNPNRMCVTSGVAHHTLVFARAEHVCERTTNTIAVQTVTVILLPFSNLTFKKR